MEDAKIIDLYFERSEQAIHETSEKYGTHLTHLAYNILHDHADSEEIVNDTYFQTWNTIPPTRPNVFKHFLSRITRNLSFNRLEYLLVKHRSRNAEQLFGELEECIPDYGSNMEEAWEARQISDSLNRYLMALEKIDCAVFLARYFYGETIPEISEKYNLPQRRVKYVLVRTRENLKIHLEKDGVVI